MSTPQLADLPELHELLRILDARPQLQVRTLGAAGDGARRLPLLAICLGTSDRDAPAVGFFGGVHGLERIGTQVVLSFLDSVVGRMAWDERIQRLLSEVRLVFMPIVNPAGMRRKTRANANGVDLMRNAPLLHPPRQLPRRVARQRRVAGAPGDPAKYRGISGGNYERGRGRACLPACPF